MFYHGSDKKRPKDQVRKVAFTLQFLGERANFQNGTTVFGTSVCCYRTCVILVNKMATRDAELSVLGRFLSKRKSSGSILTLTELNKRTSLQRRLYRKRKLKSMAIFLIFLLSHSTVERSVWQRRRSRAWFELPYETFSDNEWFENFRVSRHTFQFLVDELQQDIVRQDTLKSTTFQSPEPRGFSTAHAISKIITQTDVRIKKGFFWLWGHRRLWPQTQKKHGSVPIPQNMVRIVYTGKNLRSTWYVLLFPWVHTKFFCRVNGLLKFNS